QLSLSGLLTPWIPARWAGAALWSVHVSAVTAGTADTMFLRSFLRTRDQLPRFDVLLRLQIATTILLLLLPVFGIVRLCTFVRGGGLVARAAALGVIVACVLCWRKGDRLAGYYLVAWSVTVVAIVSLGLRGIGVPLNNTFVDQAIRIGPLLTAI